MFTIIYDPNPGPYAVTRPQLSPGYQARTLAFWLGADAEPVTGYRRFRANQSQEG
jgi:hypothetical protein